MRAHRQTQDDFVRNKIKYLLFGLLLMMASGLTNAWPALGAYGIDHMGNLCMALLVGYAILRYRLLDLRFVARRGLLYSTVTLVLTVVYLFIVFVVDHLVKGRLGNEMIIAVCVALFAALAVLPARDLIQRWIDRLFFRERLDYQDMLHKAARMMSETLDLGELTRSTMDLVDRAFHVDSQSLFVLEGNAFVCPVQFHRQTNLSKGAADAYREYGFQSDCPVVQHMAQHHAPLLLREIDTLPTFRSLWSEERETLRKTQASVLIPLLAKGQLVGFLGLGSKASGEAWVRDELNVLSTLADHLGIALDHARLFERVTQSYQELKTTQDLLVQTERLRAIGQMASGIAHDFNNLLAIILGRAELALSITADNNAIRNLEVIRKTAQGGADTVRRLVTFTRTHVERDLKPIDIHDLVVSTLEMLDSQRREREEIAGICIEIVKALQPVPFVRGSRGDLRDALTNLLLNAIDAMPQGGRLMVETREHGGIVQIVVRDTGVGMSEDVRKRVFDPFFTTKGSRGSGLGLSVAYGILARHHGNIEVESHVGRGSTFTMFLPVGDRGAREESPHQEAPKVVCSRLLVVEDDPEVGELLREMLEPAGHRVTLMQDAMTALRYAREEAFDILITDMGLPGMSGRQLAREILAIRPGTPILLVTGWGIQLDPNEVAVDGITDILPKPFSMTELHERLAKLGKTDEGAPNA